MNQSMAEKIEKIKTMPIEELCKKFNCTPDKICVGDYIARNTSDKVCPYKVILGFANFENSSVESLGDLEIVYGKIFADHNGPITDVNRNPVYWGINLKNSRIKSLGNLRKVYGSITLGEDITSMENVEFLGSNLYLNHTRIQDLGRLRVVHGRLNLEDLKCKLTSLKELEKVGSIYCNISTLRDLGLITKVNNVTFGPNCSPSAIARMQSNLKIQACLKF